MKRCNSEFEFKEWQAQYRASLTAPNNVISVRDVLEDMQLKIRSEGDAALRAYSKEFDGVPDDFQLKVSEQDIKNAYNDVSDAYVDALKRAKQNIDTFHRKQVPENWEDSENGVLYGNKYTALECVGLYVPGGRAAYPSTVLMDAIPAQIAGVDRLVMVTPPNVPAQVLVAADICGLTEIYRVGGAQAIFGLAYGTQTLPKVDKIVGPGNTYVTQAKQMVYGTVDIDKPAGPSEVLVYIQDPQYAPYAAAEMLAQLEHDPLANAIVLSEDAAILDAVQKAFDTQRQQLTRQNVLAESAKNACAILSKSLDESVQYINKIASEHLSLLVEDYRPILDRVRHSGSIFCGPYSPVTLGDYYAGPNHVLPTEGTARFASPLGVMDYMKFSSYLSYSKEALERVENDLNLLTEMEGFDGHYNAVLQRLQGEL